MFQGFTDFVGFELSFSHIFTLRAILLLVSFVMIYMKKLRASDWLKSSAFFM